MSSKVCRPRLIMALCSILVFGCSAPLPTAPAIPGIPQACAAALFQPFRLGVDPSASRQVWGVYEHDGRRFEIRWPPGFKVGGLPGAAEVIDPFGNVVGRNGQLIEDAGGAIGDPALVCAIGGKSYALE